MIDIIINDSNTSKFITLNDLIMYKVTSIASNNKQISSLIKYDIISLRFELLFNAKKCTVSRFFACKFPYRYKKTKIFIGLFANERTEISTVLSRFYSQY